MAWISEVSGYSSNNSSFYEPIIDALYAQKYNELPIPKWAESKWSSMDWAMRRCVEYWTFSRFKTITKQRVLTNMGPTCFIKSTSSLKCMLLL